MFAAEKPEQGMSLYDCVTDSNGRAFLGSVTAPLLSRGEKAFRTKPPLTVLPARCTTSQGKPK
jgi:hypothetical protein